jgi:asparagine synthase (glutamine-hydrolysing)
MCGILGIVGNIDSREFNACLEKIKHRGPDESATASYECVHMGFNRLVVNGNFQEGKQPFNVEETMHVCNGEIFNHRELEKECGYTPRPGASDCAVLGPLLCHSRTPRDFFNSLDGEFALMMVDKEKDRVIVGRDPYGVRPLFWGLTPNGSYMFSSELKGISSVCSSIQQFTPGWYMVINIPSGCSPRMDIYEYYNHLSIPPSTIHEAHGVPEKIAELLERAVKKRLMCDNGGVCSLLSGGLDSSLVAALANKHSPTPISTFAIGIQGSTDLQYAQEVANHIGSRHTSVCVDKSVFLSAIEEVIRSIESWDVTTVRASVGNYLIAKFIKNNTPFKVVLNGDYSDEVAGGYLYMKMAPSYEEFSLECRRLVGDIHFFDSLRSDRSVCAHGLEARAPFADKEFVEYYLSVDPRITSPRDQMEKYMLRMAFANSGLLPDKVLWRKKEAFSDGVSSPDDSWHTIIKNYIEGDEEEYYKSIFRTYYPRNELIIPYKWMPRYCDAQDPSARTLSAVPALA